MTTDKKKPYDLMLDENDSLILWELINAQGVAVPPSQAGKVASLYEKLRDAAIVHGHLKLPPA